MVLIIQRDDPLHFPQTLSFIYISLFTPLRQILCYVIKIHSSSLQPALLALSIQRPSRLGHALRFLGVVHNPGFGAPASPLVLHTPCSFCFASICLYLSPRFRSETEPLVSVLRRGLPPLVPLQDPVKSLNMD